MDLPVHACRIGAIWRDETASLFLPGRPELEGRPDHIHGGVIAMMLELTAICQVQHHLSLPDRTLLSPLTITMDFLRGAMLIDSHADAVIVRTGRRVIHFQAQFWQADRGRPVALAYGSIRRIDR